MTKRVLGVLAALAISGSLVACSSTDSPPATGTDAGADAADTRPPTDSTPNPVDSGPTTSQTTGKKCTSVDDCDLLGDGINVCSAEGFTAGGLYPTPVCIGIDCDPGTGGQIMGCDGNTGVCLSTGSGGICLPVCEFDDSATAPKGCEGLNGCNIYGWGKDDAGKTIGIGYCFGGCKADADCAAISGNVCQVESGLCVKAKTTYVKNIGDACNQADAQSDPEKCNCLYATSTGNGYCSKACRAGEAGTCPSGYTCDTGLPKTKLLADDTVFTSVPAGLVGNCLKDCTADADCAPLGGYCDENAGTGKKTCQIGKRRCGKDADCTVSGGTGTCTGASATTLGTCG